MSRVLLEFDARANQAEKEIKKLQKQMSKMAEQPKKASKEMGTFGKSLKDVVSQFGGIVSAGAAVSMMIREWKKDIDRSVQAAQNLGNTLRGTLAGAGLGQHTAAMRQFIQEQQGAGLGMQHEQINQVLRAFIDTRPTASVDELQNLVRTAGGLTREFGGDISAVSQIAGIGGRFMEAGVGQHRAMQLAYTMSTQLGVAAPQAMQAFQRRAGEVGAEGAMQELPAYMAMARAGQRGTSVQQLQQQYEQMGYRQRGVGFGEFIEQVPEASLPIAVRQPLRTVREGVVEMRGRLALGEQGFGQLGATYGDPVTMRQQEAARIRAQTQGRRDPMAGSQWDSDTAVVQQYQESLSPWNPLRWLPETYLAYRMGEDRKRQERGIAGYYADMIFGATDRAGLTGNSAKPILTENVNPAKTVNTDLGGR